MLNFAKWDCIDAMQQIERGEIQEAIATLRRALRGTRDRRAWSKLMLAIRELNRLIPAE